MPSLTAHLRLPEDHSRLAFHPACPVCRRERLAGSLDGEELVSQRTQAVIAAGLLAFSTGGVPTAAAAVPDEVSEGTAEVVAGDDPTTSVDLELGGETLQLPDEVPATPDTAPPAAGDDDLGPLELESATDVHEPIVAVTDDGAGAAPIDAAPAPEPAATEPTEAPAATQAEPHEDPATAQPRASEVDQPLDAAVRRVKPRAAASAADAIRATEPVAAAEPSVAGAEPDAIAEPSVAVAGPAPPPAATIRVVARSSANRAAPGDRVHVVQAGESLWSIAADRLGERATVARIAREVNRLWELNDDRIASGSPDLLFAGTRLRL